VEDVMGVELLKERVARFVISRWGSKNLLDREERASRVVEEAIELAQAEGLPMTRIERIARRVYLRPPGEPAKEAGGVMVTLLAWAVAPDLDPLALASADLDRAEAIPLDEIRARQQAKFESGTGLPVEEQ
jgi:hypothetical protein